MVLGYAAEISELAVVAGAAAADSPAEYLVNCTDFQRGQHIVIGLSKITTGFGVPRSLGAREKVQCLRWGCAAAN
jgi:hypothetical protein